MTGIRSIPDIAVRNAGWSSAVEAALILGTVPIAFVGGIVALRLAGETWNVSSPVGLAIVMMGELLTSTLFTLLVPPTFYLRVH